MAVNSHVYFPNHLGPQTPTTEGKGDSSIQENNSEEADGGQTQTEEKTAKPCECSTSSLFSPHCVIFSWLEPQSDRNKGKNQPPQKNLFDIHRNHTPTQSYTVSLFYQFLSLSKLFFKVQYISLYTY